MVVSREGFCFCLGSLGKLGEGRVSVGERGECGCGCGCGEYRSAASIERSMMWNFLFFFGVERDRAMNVQEDIRKLKRNQHGKRRNAMLLLPPLAHQRKQSPPLKPKKPKKNKKTTALFPPLKLTNSQTKPHATNDDAIFSKPRK